MKLNIFLKNEKAKNNPIAIKYSLDQILNATKKSIAGMNSIKSRCLKPGTYHKHISLWLSEFSSKNLYLIDADRFVEKPYEYLNDLQRFFELKTFIDYQNLLVFNEKKKFNCLKYNTTKPVCLGPGKGRNYSNIDENSRKYLQMYYKKPNILLKSLLKKNGYKIPSWLENN